MSKSSIIIITWNSLSYIKQTVPVLLNQKYKEIEYIYVDNGSTDGTVEYIKEQIEKNKDRNIKLIENSTNLGISKAKNQGVKASKGKYILMLDDDMLIENPNFISNIVQYYESLHNPAFLMPLFLDKEELKDGYTRTYGTYYYPFGIKKKKPKIHYKDIMAYTDVIEIAIAQGGAMFIAKSVWDTLGGFDESQKFNLDDDDISTRANIYGFKNYLYNMEYIVHLGFAKRQDGKRYALNERTYYSGKAKSILKNFSLLTNIYMTPLFGFKAFIEAIYHSIQLRYIGIFFSYIYSVYIFVRDLPDTLPKRSVIQSNRKISDKYILNLVPPKYESKGTLSS